MSLNTRAKHRARMIALAEAGLTRAEAVRKLGISKAAVRQWSIRNPDVKWVAHLDRLGEKYRDCAAQGMSLTETAAHVGVTLSTVCSWRNSHPDVKFGKHNRAKTKAVPPTTQGTARPVVVRPPTLADLDPPIRRKVKVLVSEGYPLVSALGAVAAQMGVHPGVRA